MPRDDSASPPRKRRRAGAGGGLAGSAETLSGRAFENNLQRLEDFAATHGRPPRSRDDASLAEWCGRVRRARRRGELPPARAAALEAVAGWHWEPAADQFAANLARLERFVAERGRLPTKWETAEGEPLGLWCCSRRREHRTGALAAPRAAALEAVAGWTWEPFEDAFAFHLALVQQFAAERGQPPPFTATFGGAPLGVWCCSRRREFRLGRLTEKRARDLEAVPGWWW